MLLAPASGVEVRVPPEHIPKRLMRDDHAGEKRSAGGLMVELPKDLVDQTREIVE